MKFLPLFGAAVMLACVPALCSAQESLPIGNITAIESNDPTKWAMSGFEIIHLRANDGQDTPLTRSLKMDARTVEILSRTQSPPLRASDVKVANYGGKTWVLVRRYILTSVNSADARAEGTTVRALANKWAASTRRVLPQVAPLPNRFGI
jgi:hypothetical protein